MSKIFWFDTETTGVDAQKNALVRLAYIIEINSEIVAKDTIHMRPSEKDIIEKRALEVNKLDANEIWLAPPVDHGVKKLIDIMAQFVDRYNPADKFVQGGYNVGFDDKFLRQAFVKSKDDFYGSWFYWPKLDVANEVAKWLLGRNGSECPRNFQLATICKIFDVPIKAHEAMSDIEATREVYYKLVEEGNRERAGI